MRNSGFIIEGEKILSREEDDSPETEIPLGKTIFLPFPYHWA